MKMTACWFLAGVLLGGAGVVLLRPGAGSPPASSPAATPDPVARAPRELAAAAPRPADADGVLAARLAAVEASLSRLALAVDALATRAAEGRDAARPDAGSAPRPPPLDVEAVRVRWTAVLDALEERLRAAGPEPSPREDLVLWSRWDDARKARAALESARTEDDLRRLAAGEWRATFTLP
ncbi:MAG: hypothetical protein IT460_12555 [Planctomycetes bacterium]|nr:hypothetical protein [Planctomycetota bacterium]